MSEAPVAPDEGEAGRASVAARSKGAAMIAAVAPVALAVQVAVTVVMLLLVPSSIRSFPAEYVLMPLSLWLVGFWLVIWKPELALLLALVPQHIYGHVAGELVRVRYLFALKIGVAASVLLGLGIRRLAGDREYTRVRTPLDRPMLVFAVWTAGMMLYGLARGNPVEGVLTAANELAQLPVVFFICTVVLGGFGRITDFAWVYAALNAPLALYSITTYGRGAALYSNLILLPLFALLMYGPRAIRHRPVIWAYISLCVLDVLVSQQRTLWVTMAVGFLYLMRRYAKEVRAMAGMLLVFGLAVSLVSLLQPGGETLGSALGRFSEGGGRRTTELQLGLGWWYMNGPVLGTFGGGTGVAIPWPDGQGWYPIGPHFHNFYLTLLFNLGIPGLVIWLWMGYSTLFGQGIRRLFREKNPRQLAAAVGMQAAYLAWMVGSAFSGPREGHWELAAFPALIGVFGVLADPRPDAKTAKEPETKAAQG